LDDAHGVLGHPVHRSLRLVADELGSADLADLAIPPGEYLEEVIDKLGMSKDELARRMSRPPPS
jgi:hypothetical protein